MRTSTSRARLARHIDTAARYGNEEDVGRAVRDSGIPREELFITTKLWNDDHGFDNAIEACERSLQRLGMGERTRLLLRMAAAAVWLPDSRTWH